MSDGMTPEAAQAFREAIRKALYAGVSVDVVREVVTDEVSRPG